jgi:hypothetical protein
VAAAGDAAGAVAAVLRAHGGGGGGSAGLSAAATELMGMLCVFGGGVLPPRGLPPGVLRRVTEAAPPRQLLRADMLRELFRGAE